MKETHKYYPLYHHLCQSEQPELTLTLTEIQAMLATPLPPSAWKQRSWWSNRSQGAWQAAAWLEAEFKVTKIDLESGRVTFRKKGIIYNIPQVHKEGEIILWDGKLVKALRDQLGLSQIELAKKLGMRHATISEWETGLYTPKRSTSKFLTLFAKESGFTYNTEPERDDA
ncbi:MAG: helix-turn-helix domain-containing protein [Anaerolineae bacterium]|nr:helix-turn-helix domain-containing protein [Anaerolineae bacterium]